MFGTGTVFQSAPVITDGRTPGTCPMAGVWRCFNPRPSSLTGERKNKLSGEVADWFQSAPVITDGRTRAGSWPGGCLWSFNPRPSSLTGEPRCAATTPPSPKFQSAPVITDGRTLRCQSVVGKRFFRAFARTSIHTHRLLRELAWSGEESSFESMACVAREPYREKTITWGSQ